LPELERMVQEETGKTPFGSLAEEAARRIWGRMNK